MPGRRGTTGDASAAGTSGLAGGSGVGTGVARGRGGRGSARATTGAGDDATGDGSGVGVGTGVGATSGAGSGGGAVATPPALTRWTANAASAACATAIRRIGALPGQAARGHGPCVVGTAAAASWAGPPGRGGPALPPRRPPRGRGPSRRPWRTGRRATSPAPAPGPAAALGQRGHAESRGLLQLLDDRRHRRVTAERRRAREQLVDHDAQGVEVAAEVDRVPAQLLRAHVLGRAHEGARGRDRGPSGPGPVLLGDPEVHHAHDPGVVTHQVRGLQVAVHDAHLVDRAQAGCDLQRGAPGLRRGQPAPFHREPREVLALDGSMQM